MQITVFGANGKIGSRVVKKALARGYKVTAFIHRNSNNLPKHENLKLFSGDIHTQTDVAEAIENSQAVVSTLSSWHSPSRNVLSSAMHAIVPVMESLDVIRIVTLTGFGAFCPGEKVSIFQRILHAISLPLPIVGRVIKDSEEHIRLLADSDLSWTVLRSPVMTNGGRKGTYKLRLRLPSLLRTVARDDVADAMLNLAIREEYVRKAPVIYRG